VIAGNDGLVTQLTQLSEPQPRSSGTRKSRLKNAPWLKKWRQDLVLIAQRAHILVLALRHPKVPWHAKMLVGCAVAYLFSPIQLIPTFIPVIGQLDDLFVLFVGMKCLRKLTPESVVAECEELAASWRVAQSVRWKNAIRTRKQQSISPA
jgi:uncharacterized membrane protein YkvA (DUF1232 family)